MPTRVVSLIAVAVAVLTMAGSVRAQRPSQTQITAMREACRSDFAAYCSTVPTGGGAVLACLQQHAASLTPACGAALSGLGGGAGASAAPLPAAPPVPPASRAAPAGGGGLGEACAGDYRRLCPGVEVGGGRVLACLSEHRQDVSPGCSQALSAMAH